jgi:hypothetical protein
MREAIVQHKRSGKSIRILLPDNLFCPLTKKPFVEPFINHKGITYEKDHYIPATWIGEPQPIPNLDVKQKLEELINDAFNKKEEEIRLLEYKAYINGDPQAKNELALKYLSGEDFLEKNVDIALELLQAASSAGHLPSRSLLESMNPSAFIFSSDATFPIYNPYQIDVSVQKIKKLTKQCIDYPGFSQGPHMDSSTSRKRDEYCKSVGWSITSTNVTKKIVEHIGEDCVLSLAAGRAAQETLLAAQGVKIVCTDINPPENSWMPVERLDNDQAVAKWRPQCEIAMLVWPAHIRRRYSWEPDTPIPSCHTYEAILKGNFKKIIIIGEEDGCTGSEILEEFLFKNYREVDKEWLPNWPGISDNLRILVRKTDGVVPVPKPEPEPSPTDLLALRESQKSPTAYNSDDN